MILNATIGGYYGKYLPNTYTFIFHCFVITKIIVIGTYIVG